MSLVERARATALSPKDHTEIVKRQQLANELVRQFYAGKIDLATLAKSLPKREEEKEIIIEFAGPVYGFLRRIGLDRENAKNLAQEERAHFFKAREYGLNPYFVFEISQDIDQNGQKRHYFNSFVFFEIPQNVDPQKAKQIMSEIFSAPGFFSVDNLGGYSEDDKKSLPSDKEFP